METTIGITLLTVLTGALIKTFALLAGLSLTLTMVLGG